ncbi:unnamed protein product [Cylicostephanus goldi]|uniref:UDP-N-acetylglucosamine transferase subunit ALG13 n=1 Tax=Cylicostephanus goldi TaxID=71465 RepID=A0A3P6T5L2_CYLGO|nr:unnamed protein product [Cylicostephanus goldi]
MDNRLKSKYLYVYTPLLNKYEMDCLYRFGGGILPQIHYMTCFVTVGTTRFDELVNEMLRDACISALRSVGVNKIKIQLGAGEWDADVRERVFNNVVGNEGAVEYGGIPIEYYRFKPDIQKDMGNSMVSYCFASAVEKHAYDFMPRFIFGIKM